MNQNLKLELQKDFLFSALPSSFKKKTHYHQTVLYGVLASFRLWGLELTLLRGGDTWLFEELINIWPFKSSQLTGDTLKIEFQFGHVGFEDKNWSSGGNVFLEQRKGGGGASRGRGRKESHPFSSSPTCTSWLAGYCTVWL